MSLGNFNGAAYTPIKSILGRHVQAPQRRLKPFKNDQQNSEVPLHWLFH